MEYTWIKEEKRNWEVTCLYKKNKAVGCLSKENTKGGRFNEASRGVLNESIKRAADEEEQEDGK